MAAAKSFARSYHGHDGTLLNLITWLIDFRDKEKQNLFQLVEDENDDVKIMLYGKINVRLNIGFGNLIEYITQHLSYYKALSSKDSYRACPYCSKIWAKVEGCDGTTTCGSRPTGAADDIAVYKGHKFEFVQIKGSWNLIVNQENVTVSYYRKRKTENRFNEQGEYKFESDDPHVGCGQDISWRTMKHVDDNIFIDFLNQSIKVPNFKGRRTAVEKRISHFLKNVPVQFQEVKRKIRKDMFDLGALKTLCITAGGSTEGSTVGGSTTRITTRSVTNRQVSKLYVPTTGTQAFKDPISI